MHLLLLASVGWASPALMKPAPRPPAPSAQPPVGPATSTVPPEVQACRDSGHLWLSDPDSFERTEIRNLVVWEPVWQVRDRHAGRVGHILVYPERCRVVVLIVDPQDQGPVEVALSAPPGAPAMPAEETMLRRWARLPRW